MTTRRKRSAKSPRIEALIGEVDLPRFRGRVRTWVSSTLRQLSPLVVDG